MKELLEAFLKSDLDTITVTKRLRDGGALTWTWERTPKPRPKVYDHLPGVDEVIREFEKAKARV